MGRYAVCEEEVDQLLRNEVFVDLYAIVRQGLVVGEPSYSLKNIERRYPAMPRPDLVGITAFTSQANRAYEVAAQFRRQGVPVVMGGIHATTCLAEAMERVDSVVTGEAESVWPQVLADTRNRCLKRRYDGGFAEIDSVPPERHDLLTRGYAPGATRKHRTGGAARN